MDTKKAFAERLNQLLDSKGIPEKYKGREKALAELFNVSPKTASNWLNGLKLPQYWRQIKMAEIYNVRTDWLISGNGLMHLEHDSEIALDAEEKQIIMTMRSLSELDRQKIVHIIKILCVKEDQLLKNDE